MFGRFDQIVYLRDDTTRNYLCECEVEATSNRILCQKSIIYTLMKLGGFHGSNKHNCKNHKQ